MVTPGAAMLEIRDLVVSYHGSRVLSDVNLRLEYGDSMAIIGESGAGKTTLGLAIMGFSEGTTSGQICWQGRDLLRLPEEDMRSLRGKVVAMVFQNVEDALNPVLNIHDQVKEAMTVHRNGPGHAASARAFGLLEAVGLDHERAKSFPHQLSGGERQRALIAMALANDPDILILDEPTASLDSVTKGDVIEILRAAASDKISLVITHDISTAASLSKKMAVLYAGTIVEMGRTEDLLKNPRHPYTRGLIRSYPNMTTTKDLQGIPGRMDREADGCPFHRRCTQRTDICSRLPPSMQETNGRLIACHRGGIVPLLKLRGITKSFGQREVLSNVSLTVLEGETLAVVGESGCGKTTLARITIGLCDPDRGDVLFEDETLRVRGLEFYRKVQMIYQNPAESLSHRMSVLDLVREPLDVQRLGGRQEREASVRKALDDVELPSDDRFLARYPHQLSGGEAQRVAIARAMVLQPKLLIADEPTSALDASIQAKILRLLQNLQEKRGLSMLFITHDLALARKVSDRIAVLHRGMLVEEGPASQVVSSPAHPYTRCLLEQAARLDATIGSPGVESSAGRGAAAQDRDRWIGAAAVNR
ncbi:MAG: Trehalose/maltose import ATP-binding protein MalK [Methanosaeta sp. PtaB.Bin039]|nr:MAG: Trehalose/maltose import ATP-binding protein MalK [Methanosaeta sp. PtaB.Bin039]HOT07726.1 ABC transporter ATP-binding protein [Methanotrichaceae archaeon]HQF17418.1 ABC transporter ATP-binding protein [Methanotrichaceae archaeon]HQI92176.1 ABC transporter ATP-binding protein [Methanotrichaceae archaeon]